MKGDKMRKMIIAFTFMLLGTAGNALAVGDCSECNSSTPCSEGCFDTTGWYYSNCGSSGDACCDPAYEDQVWSYNYFCYAGGSLVDRQTVYNNVNVNGCG